MMNPLHIPMKNPFCRYRIIGGQHYLIVGANIRPISPSLGELWRLIDNKATLAELMEALCRKDKGSDPRADLRRYAIYLATAVHILSRDGLIFLNGKDGKVDDPGVAAVPHLP